MGNCIPTSRSMKLLAQHHVEPLYVPPINPLYQLHDDVPRDSAAARTAVL